MPRKESPISPAAGLVAEFGLQLRMLRHAAGRPSYREMARRVHYSAPTLSKAANGRAVPTWDCVEAYLRACNVTDALDFEQWRHQWQQARHTAGGSPATTEVTVHQRLAAATKHEETLRDQAIAADAVAAVESVRMSSLGESPQAQCPTRVMVIMAAGLLRDALAQAIATDDNLTVVVEAADLDEVWDTATTAQPAVAVVDLATSRDVQAVRRFYRTMDCPAVALVGPDSLHLLGHTLDDGLLMGAVAKDADTIELRGAITRVAAGELCFSSSLVNHLVRRSMIDDPFEALTQRELEVLKYLCEGRSNKQIARILDIAVSTVSVHVTHILAKLNVSSRTEAVLLVQVPSATRRTWPISAPPLRRGGST